MDKGKWIIPYLKQYRGLFLLAIFMGGITILFGAALMFTSGYLISKAATRPESILMVYVPIVGVRTFAIGRAVLSYIERLTGHQLVLKILSDMRVRLYKILEPQAILLRSRFFTGDILEVLADDIEHLQDFYLKSLFPSVVSLVIYAVILFSAGIFSIPFAVFLAVYVGILIFVTPLLSYLYSRAKNEKVKQGKHLQYLQLTDAIFGIGDWLFSGRHQEFLQQSEKQQQQILQMEKKIHSFINWRALWNQSVLGIIVVFAVYWANGMSMSGKFPPTFIAAVALASLSLLETFLPVSEAAREASTYQDSIKRLNSLETKDQPIWDHKEKPENIDTSNVSIEFQHVFFRYPQAPPLLQDFNLHIAQGEKIAILGPSGAGKSTMLKLIQGAMAATDGNVFLNGKEAHHIPLSIPKMISVLNQRPYLFHTSVLNNLRLGNPDATEDEVYQAARQVGLHHMIMELPSGYDTNMNEAGQRFSGGERQRIALARILLQKTPVVIMDEPTVGLDPLTENQLLTVIFEILKGKTILWATHHLAGMEKMDRILFMDKGKIRMAGTHRQLLETEERYRRLYAMDHPFSE